MDPADLRAEPIEDEIDLEYLVYGLFERPDRPDGAFLSKRWVPMDNLLERGGYGNLKVKIDEYEASKAKRVKATIESKFNCVAAERGDGGREACAGGSGHSGEDSEELRTVRTVRTVTVRTVTVRTVTVRRQGQVLPLLKYVGVAARGLWMLLHELSLHVFAWSMCRER